MKKLSDTEAELEKGVAYKKVCISASATSCSLLDPPGKRTKHET